ncbi:MAG: hypothetical protein KDE09_24260 [Anaerolineales bacterium]|nr:hypothetical protein [Anaerolineales bacterium]
MHDEANVPKLTALSYLPLTAICLWENLPQVLIGAFFFSLACTPSFVLLVLGFPWLALLAGIGLAAPAWASLLHYEGFLAQGRVRSANILFSHFRLAWPDSVRLSAIAVAILAPVFWLLAMDGSAAEPLHFLLWVPLIVSGLLILATIVLYAFPICAVFDTPLQVALRSGVILSARNISNTLGLVAMAILATLAVYYISLGLLFFLPAVFGLFVVNNCLLVVDSPECPK